MFLAELAKKLDIGNEARQEERLKSAFCQKMERIHSKFIFPDSKEPEFSIELGNIDWRQVDDRFLRLLKSPLFRFPDTNSEGVVRISGWFAKADQNSSASLKLSFGTTISSQSKLEFSVFKPGKTFFAYYTPPDDSPHLTQDNVALLVGEKPSVIKTLEIAKLSAEFVQQTLDGRIMSRVTPLARLG